MIQPNRKMNDKFEEFDIAIRNKQNVVKTVALGIKTDNPTLEKQLEKMKEAIDFPKWLL